MKVFEIELDLVLLNTRLNKLKESERDFYKLRDHNVSANDVSKCIRVKTKSKQYYFSYIKYGSKQQALDAAREFRDDLPIDSFRGNYDHDKNPSRGESGILGVAKYMQRGDHVGWTACWQQGRPPLRFQRKNKFSFLQYGSDALSCAAKHRDKMVFLHSIAKS